MNTPAHLLIGAAVMGRRHRPALIWAALAGALLPDLSLYLLAGWSLFVMQIPPEVVFGSLYFSDLWQTIFAVDNSFFVWGAVAAFAVWRRSAWLIALSGAGLLHLCLDFPLHHDDGRPHFWPLSNWIFESPLSYWDTRHGAGWIAPFELLLAGISLAVILWRKPGWKLALLCVTLMGCELFIIRQWLIFFQA